MARQNLAARSAWDSDGFRSDERGPSAPNASAEMGRRAFAWIVRNAAEFVRLRDGDGDGERADAMRVKRCAELALVADCLKSEMKEGQALLVCAWDALERGDCITRLLHAQPIIIASYLPFRMAGLRSPTLEKSLIETSWLREYHTIRPFGRMAIGVVLESIGVSPPWDMSSTVAAIPFFDHPTSATPAIRAAFLAHAVMWRSDMGRNPAGVGGKATALYREASQAWHPVLIKAGLLDPLAEMVIADVCIGDRSPDATLATLCAAQRRDGSMPAHVLAPTDRFDDLYHPTVAAALAGVLPRARSGALLGLSSYWAM